MVFFCFVFLFFVFCFFPVLIMCIFGLRMQWGDYDVWHLRDCFRISRGRRTQAWRIGREASKQAPAYAPAHTTPHPLPQAHAQHKHIHTRTRTHTHTHAHDGTPTTHIPPLRCRDNRAPYATPVASLGVCHVCNRVAFHSRKILRVRFEAMLSPLKNTNGQFQRSVSTVSLNGLILVCYCPNLSTLSNIHTYRVK